MFLTEVQKLSSGGLGSGDDYDEWMLRVVYIILYSCYYSPWFLSRYYYYLREKKNKKKKLLSLSLLSSLQRDEQVLNWNICSKFYSQNVRQLKSYKTQKKNSEISWILFFEPVPSVWRTFDFQIKKAISTNIEQRRSRIHRTFRRRTDYCCGLADIIAKVTPCVVDLECCKSLTTKPPLFDLVATPFRDKEKFENCV